MTVDVIVIGGGISGLAAGYELLRRGVSVRILEASNRPGGVIQTDRFDGWVVDGGPDSMLVQKPAAVALCAELGIADRLVPTLTPRTAYVLRAGQLHPIVEGSFLGFPIRVGGLARSSLFTWRGKMRMACEVLVPKGEPADDESIASFVRRRFGREAADYLAEPLLAGIHAGDADRLSVHALFPRLVEAERQTGSVIRAMRSMHVAPSPRGAFVALPGGVRELVDNLARALGPETLSLATPVRTISRSGPSPERFTVDTPAGVLHARAVIVAVPAYVAGDVLGALHPELAALCREVPYASTATVAFGYRRDQVGHPMLGSGFVVPRVEQNPLLAGTWVTSKWPGRAPDGHVLLRGFLGGGRDPRRLDQPDEALIALSQGALVDLMRISGPPLFARLYRWTRQSPQYEVGHLRRVAAIEAALAGAGGLFLTGSGFRSIGIPDCIADGRAAAARAAALVA